jgi:hypothetical protein
MLKAHTLYSSSTLTVILGNVATYSIIPPVPSLAFTDWMYVLASSNSLTLESPFTLTIVTMSPLLWSNPCIVIITLNMSFFLIASGEVMACATASESALRTDVAIIPSSDADRNTNVSSRLFLALNVKCSSFIDWKFKYFSD